MKIVHNADIIEFHPNDSDETILGFIRHGGGYEMGRWKICLSSFDDDPRELIEIPRACQFARRLVNLGILPLLTFPKPGGYALVEDNAPGLSGIALHATANGSGRIQRRGGKVHITMDVDMVGYFKELLKAVKERKDDPPKDIITMLEGVIEKQSKFDPLKGSSKFISDIAFDEASMQRHSRV